MSFRPLSHPMKVNVLMVNPRKQLLLAAVCGAIATLSTFALPASEAEACSPAPPTLRLNYFMQDGEVAPRQPVILLNASDVTPINPSKFTLSNAQGQTFPVATDKVVDVLFDTYHSVRVNTPLPEGDYTLTYETEDNSVAPDPNQPPPTYVAEVTFSVAKASTHPEVLEMGVDWTKIKPGPNDPVFADSCGGSNAEDSKVLLSMASNCRTQPYGIRYVLEFGDVQGGTSYAVVRNVPNDAFMGDFIEFETGSYSQNGSTTECLRVTAFTSNGLKSDTYELCTPTRCGTGTTFPPDSGYTDCPNAGGNVTSYALPTPYPESACQLSSGFDPCEGVMCAMGEECREGMCVSTDPCDGVTCPDGQACNAGTCEDVDPCDGVTCADGEICNEGVCEAVDPCDGVTCADGEACMEGACVSTDPCDGVTCAEGETCEAGQCIAPEVDPCENVMCEADQICVEGKCYAEVTPNGDPGNNTTPSGNNTTAGNNSSGGNNATGGENNSTGGGNNGNNSAEDEGCQTAAPAAPAGGSLALLGLLGFLGLARRRRR